MKQSKVIFYIVALITTAVLSSCKNDIVNPLAIKVKINDTLYNKDVSGKLIFLFSQDTTEQLIFGVNPYNPQPVFTYDIQNWNPKDTIVINKFTDEWYKKFTDLEGAYACRVILDINTEECSFLLQEGTGTQED